MIWCAIPPPLGWRVTWQKNPCTSWMTWQCVSQQIAPQTSRLIPPGCSSPLVNHGAILDNGSYISCRASYSVESDTYRNRKDSSIDKTDKANSHVFIDKSFAIDVDDYLKKSKILRNQFSDLTKQNVCYLLKLQCNRFTVSCDTIFLSRTDLIYL